MDKRLKELWPIVRGPTGMKTRSLFADVMRSLGFYTEAEDSPYWLERAIASYDDPRPCVKEHFMERLDPTGYETAIHFFGSYDHWKYMYNTSPWFKKAVDVWLEEMNDILRSKAISRIRDIAFNDEDKQSLTAAKYLASREWEKQDTRGRPSNQEITGKLKQAVKDAESEAEDMERIGLTLIRGGKK